MMLDKPRPRGSYLGGHQIGAVVGIHPYLTIHEVFAHAALGLDPATSKDKRALFKRGEIVEVGMRLDTEDAYGVEIVAGTFWLDDELPFIGGSPDGLTWGADGAPEMLWEFTSTTSRALDMWGEDGDPDGAAGYKLVQVQWYLGLTGFPRAIIVLLVVDTGELRYYPIERDDEMIARLRDAGDVFWTESVMLLAVPDVVDSAAGWEAVGRGFDLCHRGALETMENPPAALVALAADYGTWRDIESHAEEQKKEAAAKIKAIVADHRGAKWKATKPGDVDANGNLYPATAGGSITYSPKKPADVFDAAAAFDELADMCDGFEDVVDEVRAKHTTRAPHPGRTFQVRLSGRKSED